MVEYAEYFARLILFFPLLFAMEPDVVKVALMLQLNKVAVG